MFLDNAVSAPRQGNFPVRPDSVWMRQVQRRTLVRSAAGGIVAGGMLASSAGCGAAAAPAAAAVFNPATSGWLSQIGLAIGATLVTDGIKVGLKGAWEKWGPGVRNAVTDSKDSYEAHYRSVWCHSGPPVVLAGTCRTSEADPMTDRLVACVNEGRDAVVLEAWAWQGISMFVHELTKDKAGDELARLKALCALTLIPSGVRPSSGRTGGRALEFVTYATRSNGYVDIGWVKEPDDSKSVYVTVTGIPNADNNPTTKKFTLPTSSA